MTAMEIDFAWLLTPLLFIGLRVSGLVLFAPVLGSAALPARIKAVLVIAITAVLYPALRTHIAQFSLAHWPLLVLRELGLGIAMGLAANLLFDAAQFAGQVLSIQMGYSLASLMDPQTQVESTVMSLFQQMIATLVFLELNVHHALLRAIAASFGYLPVGEAHITAPLAASLAGLGGMVFVLGLRIAAPVVAATLVADVVIGLLGKASPQMPLILLGPALKSLLGAAVLMGAITYWPDLLQRGFAQSMAYVENLLRLAR